MVHRLLAAGVFLALAVIAGCSGGEPSSEPTGIAAVDAAIDAIERGDRDALLDQVQLSPFACTGARLSRFGAYSCTGDAIEGAIEAFPVDSCGTSYFSRDFAGVALMRILPRIDGVENIHAVFETARSGFSSGFFAPTKASHVIVLREVLDDGKFRGGLLVGNSGIVGYANACGEPAADFVKFWGLPDALLEFPTSEPTGIVAVDAAIDAIERQDADALASQVRLSLVYCEIYHVDALSIFPPCGDEPNGTQFERFPVGKCDAFDYSAESAEQSIRDILTPDPEAASVYGVFETKGSSFVRGTYGTVRPQYIIVLETARGDSLTGSGLLLNHRGIVGYAAGCDSSPSDFLLESGLGRPIIPPPTPTALPTPPLTGIASVDAAIDAIRRGDGDALVAQMRLTFLACEERRVDLSLFLACDGAPEGTMLGGFPVSSCEIGYVSPKIAAPIVAGVASASPTKEVFAVFSTAGTRLEASLYSHAEPMYVVVLRTLLPDREAGSGLLIGREGVVGHTGACISTPRSMISFLELTDAIIPPPDER